MHFTSAEIGNPPIIQKKQQQSRIASRGNNREVLCTVPWIQQANMHPRPAEMHLHVFTANINCRNEKFGKTGKLFLVTIMLFFTMVIHLLGH